MSNTLVTLDGIRPFVSLELYDARLAQVRLPHNLWKTSVELPAGGYIARFATSLWKRDESFIVLPQGHVPMTIRPREISQMLVKSAAPLLGSGVYLKGDADLASLVALAAPIQVEGHRGDGCLFLMIRRRLNVDLGPECSETSFLTPPWTDISILDGTGKKILDLETHMKSSIPNGVAAINIALDEGPYRLKIASPGHIGFVSQFVYIAKNHQTQVFFLDRPDGAEGYRPWARARLSCQIVHLGLGFDPNSEASLATEELTNLWQKGDCIRPAPEWREFLGSPERPGLDMAYFLGEIDPWNSSAKFDQDGIEALCKRLPCVPDANLIRFAAHGKQIGTDSENEPLDFVLWEFPMTSRAWDIALHAEIHRGLTIPAGSRPVRLAESILSSSPWLRIANRDEDFDLLPSVSQACLTKDEADTLQFEFLETIQSLRDLVAEDMSVRIPFTVTTFSVLERRLVDLICPWADSAVFHLLQEARMSGDMPSRDELARALRLPQHSLYGLAYSVIDKLAENRVLPTHKQLDSFVLEETAEDGALVEPPGHLEALPSKFAHLLEESSMSLLSLVYLRFRGSLGHSLSFQTLRDLAQFLNKLGYVVEGTRERIDTKDVDDSLRNAEALLSRFHKNDSPPTEGGVWEDIAVRFTDPKEYTPGSLCRVTRHVSDHVLPPGIEKSWNDREFAFSLSLKMAADPLFGRGLDHSGTEQLTLKGTLPKMKTPHTRAQYLASIRSLEVGT